MLKRCFKCGEDKPRADFYRHAAMTDGLLGKCKSCTKADASQYWHQHGDVLRQTDSMRRKLRRAVRYVVGNAVRDGKIEQAAHCHYCHAETELSAHHWNYYRPLDVTWLCDRCHRIADMARRDAEIKVALATEETA